MTTPIAAGPLDRKVSHERTIFAVFARWEYEGEGVVKAFEDKADADAFRDECASYAETKESAPEIHDTPENDAEFEAWWERDRIWTEQHPAKNAYSADSYVVGDLTLVMANDRTVGRCAASSRSVPHE